MSEFSLSHLSVREKDDVILAQAAVIARLEGEIELLRRQIKGLDGPGGGGSGAAKTSQNSHLPPSQDMGRTSKPAKPSSKKRPRPPRPGVFRRLSSSPGRTLRLRACSCGKCGADVSGQRQGVRHRYDWVDIPPIAPEVTRIELEGGRCAACGARFKAAPPAGQEPGTPFGPNIHAFLLTLHNAHHVAFERLSRLMKEMFGLTISEGAISNALSRSHPKLEEERETIRAELRKAPVIASDETTARLNGQTWRQWTFVSETAVLHEISPNRSRSVALQVLGGHKPEIWVSDRYSGQQELAGQHQICLAHLLRDVQYAMDCGDGEIAPRLRKLLLWSIGAARRRKTLSDATLEIYHGRAQRTLDELVRQSALTQAGRGLQAIIKAWRSKFFVFLTDRRVPPTNNESEREIRPAVVHRKVTGGFRSEWGARAYAAWASVAATARKRGAAALDAVRALIAPPIRLASTPTP